MPVQGQQLIRLATHAGLRVVGPDLRACDTQRFALSVGAFAERFLSTDMLVNVLSRPAEPGVLAGSVVLRRAAFLYPAPCAVRFGHAVLDREGATLAHRTLGLALRVLSVVRVPEADVPLIRGGSVFEAEELIELRRVPHGLGLVIPSPDRRPRDMQRLALAVVALAEGLLTEYLFVDILARAAIPDELARRVKLRHAAVFDPDPVARRRPQAVADDEWLTFPHRVVDGGLRRLTVVWMAEIDPRLEVGGH